MQKKLIVSTNISTTKGQAKHPVSEIILDLEGIIGDQHRGISNRQISILGKESIDRFNELAGKEIGFGIFGENLTISGIDLRQAAILEQLKIGDVILEITQVGKKCYSDECIISQRIGACPCPMPEEGVFARVLRGGKITVGDEIEYLPKVLRVLIITMSDRATKKVYQDLSGPAAKELIVSYFATTKWPNVAIANLLLPDDAQQLEANLRSAIEADTDLIFTLGGTGIGPRDITPEVVMKIADKIIPGVMENVRIKYGATKPAALLSRSVAAIAENTQIYAIPGSVHAVTEYLNEILPVLEHAIYMLHGIDKH